ncbi:hypothetical protein SmJEL517_g01351 [Synchytrium microbalum]|uniref:Phospholipid/glycerol acyltransferase domain-containing protein n=1 Tax=Synchytrium microbalum TaxID=1806994 RepID=A0A507C650_9FUNG|nr:uncharacterized protein SmJEL517_g01351 [Synchytrium microbalum]TPX36507.1 hypothetical protein SmJEL517_g01351 [Synchytrium microbalum]
MEKRFIGALARWMSSIPVDRPQDLTKLGSGFIYVDSPTSTTVKGISTKFTTQTSVRSTITVTGGSAEVVEILSDTELVIKKPFEGKDPAALASLLKLRQNSEGKTVGSTYKVTPFVDQTNMFKSVIERLANGEVVGIFPEGGSHDRTDFLPLKAGVTIMALSAMAAHDGLDVKIIPVGLNYFNPDRFRSRAVVEYGEPISITPEQVEQFKRGGTDKRAVCGNLLDTILYALKQITVTAPDYDTLMLIQASRRLYAPDTHKLSLAQNLELTRRLMAGYLKFKDDPRQRDLLERVSDYNQILKSYGIRDSEVKYTTQVNRARSMYLFIARLLELLVLMVLATPGMLLFGPTALVARYYSHRMAKAALKGSSVKISGRDVISTWKVLVTLVLSPLLYTIYSTIVLSLVSSRRAELRRRYKILVFCLSWITWPFLGYATIRISEEGLALARSLRPLWLGITDTSAANALQKSRTDLRRMIHLYIDALGPTAVSDFVSDRIVPPLVTQAQLNYADVASDNLIRGESVEAGFGWDRLDDDDDDGVFFGDALSSPNVSPEQPVAPGWPTLEEGLRKRRAEEGHELKRVRSYGGGPSFGLNKLSTSSSKP